MGETAKTSGCCRKSHISVEQGVAEYLVELVLVAKLFWFAEKHLIRPAIPCSDPIQVFRQSSEVLFLFPFAACNSFIFSVPFLNKKNIIAKENLMWICSQKNKRIKIT
ncbi:MAG: hypothetical protein GXO75_15970 [Calditrichaeota bacterium]|nr:hypothetical protein [Calditrichota bacterium]